MGIDNRQVEMLDDYDNNNNNVTNINSDVKGDDDCEIL